MKNLRKIGMVFIVFLLSLSFLAGTNSSNSARRGKGHKGKSVHHKHYNTNYHRMHSVSADYVEITTASYYCKGFSGRKTANGERYNCEAMTAAHKTLPFNTRVKVTNLGNGKSVVVRINDAGPYISGRGIDLSLAAAREIGMLHSGTARVRVEVVK